MATKARLQAFVAPTGKWQKFQPAIFSFLVIDLAMNMTILLFSTVAYGSYYPNHPAPATKSLFFSANLLLPIFCLIEVITAIGMLFWQVINPVILIVRCLTLAVLWAVQVPLWQRCANTYGQFSNLCVRNEDPESRPYMVYTLFGIYFVFIGLAVGRIWKQNKAPAHYADTVKLVDQASISSAA